jgi:type 1 fimbria pilin
MSLILSGSDGVSDIDGSASTPAIRGTDANTGIFFPAADTIAFAEGGAEVARFDSSGNLGIGTSSPISKLSVLASGTAVTTVSSDAASNATIEGPNVAIASSFSSQLAILSNSSVAADTGGGIAFGGKYNGNAFAYYAAVKTGKDNATSGQFGGYLSFASRANGGDITERARITSGGLFQFNSGYGSVATAYGCRAWVNFDGTGTPAIRASGNVTSITDQGTGDYTVNITTAMPDANYSAVATAQRNNNGGTSWVGLYGGTSLVQTTTTVRVQNLNASQALEDPRAFCVAIFR